MSWEDLYTIVVFLNYCFSAQITIEMKMEFDEGLIEEFQDRLGYTFNTKNYLYQALTTISYSNENDQVPHNESLATLGDAVAKLIITQHAVKTLKMTEKGDITEYKEKFEPRETMTENFQRVFPECENVNGMILRLLRLGKGERTNRQYLKNNFWGELLEAIFGSIFLDTFMDLVRTQTVIKRVLQLRESDFHRS